MSDSENQRSSEKDEKMDVSDGDKHKEIENRDDSKSGESFKDEEKEEDDEEDDDEDEPLPLGLLERPVLTTGKREKKKVERLSMAINLPNNDRKKVEIQEGSGTKLGDCPRIEFKLGHTKAVDLKPLHRLLFTRAGSNTEVKRNIRLFSGFTFKKDDKEYEKRVAALNKMTIPGLKQICEILDIERSGAKPVVVERIMDFLMKPTSSGLKVPQKKKRKSKGSGEGEKKGSKKKETKKDAKGKTKKDISDLSDSDDEEQEIEEKDEKEEEEEEETAELKEEESEEEPPKKKAKVEKKLAKKEKENAKTKKQNGKEEKPSKKEKKEMKKETKKEIKKETKKKVSDSEDSDDEPLVSKKEDPPTNDELKDVIKKILDGANLEEVTMKTVVKQVYDKYPTYDLTDRKDFIKATVKQIIS